MTEEERRAKHREATRRWQLNNKPHRAQYARQWRRDNPDAERAIKRRAYAKHKDKHDARMARYREKNFDRIKEMERARRAADPERFKANNIRWRERNAESLKVIYRAKQLRKFGLTIEDYDRLFQAQGGRCALCSRTQKRRLAVDHDHFDGHVRGLLCTACNTAIGRLGDTVGGLMKAVEYLQAAMAAAAASHAAA